MKRFLMKQLLKRQMKGAPEGEQEKMLQMIEKDPELFQKIAREIQGEMDAGKDQMSATMVAVKKYQEELRKLM